MWSEWKLTSHCPQNLTDQKTSENEKVSPCEFQLWFSDSSNSPDHVSKEQKCLGSAFVSGRYTLSDHLTPLEGFQPPGQGTFGLREFKSLRGSVDICLVSQGSRSQCRQSIVFIPLNVMFFSAPPPHFWEVLFTPCFTHMAIHTDSSSPRPPSIPSTTACHLRSTGTGTPLQRCCANNTAHGCKPLCLLWGFSYKNDWAPFYSRTLYICPSSFMRIREDRVSHTRQESKEIFTQKCYEDFPAHLSSVIVIKVPLRLMESAIVRSPSDSSSGSD